MKKLVTFSAAALAATIVSSDLTAQRDLKAGFSTQSQVVDLDTATGEFGSLGIQHLNGEIFATTRINPAVGGLHFVSVFDNSGSGVSVRSWPQPGFAQASEWGFRDGATDGTNLFFGFDFGVQIVDVNGVSLNGLAGPNLLSANGPHIILGGLVSGNVLNPDQAGITRSLAYDRSGNAGEGSFWTGNFGSSTFEINIAGDIIQTNPQVGEIKYGMGLDPLSPARAGEPVGTSILWINSAPNSGTIAEYDVVTGTLTGVVMDMGQNGTSVQGGLDVVPGTLGRGPNASGTDILHLQQGQPDEFRIRRLHLDQAGQGVPASPNDRNGAREPDVQTTIDDGAIFDLSDRGSLNYTIDTAVLNLKMSIDNDPGDLMGTGGLNGTVAVMFINIGADAAPGVDSTSNALGIRELTHLQPLLTIPFTTTAPRNVGMLLSNDPLLASASEFNPALTPGSPFAAIGECIRAQGLFVDTDVAFLPVAMTNQVRLCRGPDPIILSGTFAEFNGANTFNANTTSGYNSLTNEEIDPAFSIVHVTYSINPNDPLNSATTQALFDNFFRWDTDNGGMADVFEAGDSTVMGCQGTFRNLSEVNTGLIFTGTAQQNATPCDPLSLQGWVGTDDGPTAFGGFDGDWLTVDFDYSPDIFMNSQVFEWDADTDGGVGVSGSAMAGVIVTVTFRNGTISSGEVVPDVNNPNRGFVQL